MERSGLHAYRREIVIVLIVKLVLVMLLKQAFFSDPVSKTLDAGVVSEAFIGINPDSSR